MGRSVEKMSMRFKNDKLTICEVLRKINDNIQHDNIVDTKKIRDMLCYAEVMAKKIVAKLREYNEQYDNGWWENNPEYKNKFDREMETYLIGDHENGRRLLNGEKI